MQNLIIKPENERQGPHFSVEPVPTRTSVSSAIPVPILSRGNQDKFTDERRQRYGETERFNQPVSNNMTGLMVPNDTKTPNNPTRNEQINGTMQRHSSQ